MCAVTNLHVAFRNIERGDGSVGEATRNDAAEHALGVVGGVVGDGAEVPVVRVSGSASWHHVGDVPRVPLAYRHEMGHGGLSMGRKR